jgi:hypothetical protein
MPKGTPFEKPARVEREPGAMAQERAGPASVTSVRLNTGFVNENVTPGGHVIQSQRDIDLSGADLRVGSAARKPRRRPPSRPR